MTDTRCPARAPGARLSGRGSRPVLDFAGRTLGLNETALAIWDLCDGSTTVAEMVVAVVELTGIDADQVTADVVRVVDEYTRLGIVTIRN
jgi:pyrroloquinoline quinone biosynthesis protein D